MTHIFKSFFITCLILFFSQSAYPHSGSHGNNECIFKLADTDLRLSGYQFKGGDPDRHYCRHFPHFGQTIIKIDSISSDLSQVAVELQLLKRNSWTGLLLNNDDAFSVIKTRPLQYFSGSLSKGVVSIDADIQELDIFALNIRLHNGENIIEEKFLFVVGFPFAQIMVGISVLLLFLLTFIVLRQKRSKGQQ